MKLVTFKLIWIALMIAVIAFNIVTTHTYHDDVHYIWYHYR
jgi:hypothetical protein